MTEIKNQVEYVPLDTLKELEGNPRTIKKDRFEKLKKSIQDNRDYFEGRPILVNEVDGVRTIFAGNQRYKAAKALGWTEVPAVVYKDLPIEKQRELTIRDNVELGDWDMDALANDWDEEELEEWGVPIDLPDVDFDSIEGNQDRHVSDKPTTVKCPKCGEEFEI